MSLRRARIATFRCLRDVELTLDSRCNYVYGANGAGKTSILEALYLLGRGRSFRTRQIRRLIQRGESGFAVFGELSASGGPQRLGVAFADGRLEKRVDGRPTAGTAELAMLLPAQVIDPGIHEIVQGAPVERRRFLDWGVFHVEHGYLDAWRRYRRVLGQRNAALKAGAGRAELTTWADALIEAGGAVHDARARYAERLGPVVASHGQALLGEALELRYRPGWTAELPFADALAAAEGRDRALGGTTVGPHRADLWIGLGAEAAQDRASRGQQKLAAAALILGQAELAAAGLEEGGTLLLVDDPAAELDAPALRRLLAAVEASRAQLVVTALTPEQLPPRPGFPVFHVERGVLRGL